MTLPALPEESFQRVLCVVAHPDDMEYGTSAAPKDIIPKFAAMSGKAMGVEHAVLFRAHDLHAPPEFLTEAMQD